MPGLPLQRLPQRDGQALVTPAFPGGLSGISMPLASFVARPCGPSSCVLYFPINLDYLAGGSLQTPSVPSSWPLKLGFCPSYTRWGARLILSYIYQLNLWIGAAPLRAPLSVCCVSLRYSISLSGRLDLDPPWPPSQRYTAPGSR